MKKKENREGYTQAELDDPFFVPEASNLTGNDPIPYYFDFMLPSGIILLIGAIILILLSFTMHKQC